MTRLKLGTCEMQHRSITIWANLIGISSIRVCCHLHTEKYLQVSNGYLWYLWILVLLLDVSCRNSGAYTIYRIFFNLAQHVNYLSWHLYPLWYYERRQQSMCVACSLGWTLLFSNRGSSKLIQHVFWTVNCRSKKKCSCLFVYRSFIMRMYEDTVIFHKIFFQ
jgi:hypothetical protein